MKRYTGRTSFLLGCLAAGTVLCRWWMIRMPCREFARWALYMAVLDDEICRNELEGNWIGESKIVFPPRAETLQTRYHCFLQQNRKKSRRQLQREAADMEQRLRDSRQYVDQPKEWLEVFWETML